MLPETDNFELDIVIVETVNGAASSLITMLGRSRQNKVTLLKQQLHFFNGNIIGKPAMVFVYDHPESDMDANEIVRRYNALNLTPSWCKFVIVSAHEKSPPAEALFRHLRVEQLEHDFSICELIQAIRDAQRSIRMYRNTIIYLDQAPPRILVHQLSHLEQTQLTPLQIDELMQLKIKILLRGGRPDLAWSICEKISDKRDKLREQLYISFRTGNEPTFLATLAMAEHDQSLPRTCLYYRAFWAIQNGKLGLAVGSLEQLANKKLTLNELESYALLITLQEGVDKATHFISDYAERFSQQKTTRLKTHLFTLKCLFCAYLAGEFYGQDKTAFFNAVAEHLSALNEVDCVSSNGHYKPFFVLCFAVLKGKNIEQAFEKLYRYRKQLDATQLVMLLFVAQKQMNERQSSALHELLDKTLARLEIGPELISFVLLYRQVLASTMYPKLVADKYRELAKLHEKEGRLLRALQNLYFGTLNTDIQKSDKESMLTLMQKLHLTRFWSLTAQGLEQGIQQMALENDTGFAKSIVDHGALEHLVGAEGF